MCYGTDGETPVSDAELTSHLEDEMVYIRYVVVPLYNTSTFALLMTPRRTQMLELAQTAAESCTLPSPMGPAPDLRFQRRRRRRPARHLRGAGWRALFRRVFPLHCPAGF